MHSEVMDYFVQNKEKHPHYFSSCRVLEVGSLDINGGIRIYFDNCEFIGLDVGPGAGVDVVCEGQNYEGEDNSFDTIATTECFEHNPYWVETFQNMIRMVKPDGLIIMTCATTGRAEHGTTRADSQASPFTIAKGWDYYKNLTKEDFEESFDLSSHFREYEFATMGTTLLFYGIKKS
jgi:SAM-dependent methyltransferase